MEAFRKRGSGGRRAVLHALLLAAFCAALGGCSIKQADRTKVGDLNYVIVEEAGIPEELAAMIEEKKASDFRLTYEADGALYIVRGYGEQATGGYSICIRGCYLTSDSIVFDTELIGPRKGETTSKSPSFPYIVIKTETRGENTVFE